MTGSPLGILAAPDSFKGSLTSVAVAQALAAGWTRGRPSDTVRLAPLADGGEGTIEAILAAGSDWLPLPVSARDPLGRLLPTRFIRDGDRAVVEMAEASGLSRVSADERDPMAASTFGTGLILAAAIGLGVRDVVLGIGGSATTDGGSGILRALGARFLDREGRELADGGGPLEALDRIDLIGLSPILGEVRLTLASDVTNPLLGQLGAAAVYGPQKGASDAQVARLDANLELLADRLEAAVGRAVRESPGAGAAGGTGFGLLAIADRFASFEIRPGVDIVMDLIDFDEALAATDLVLTGEGRIDAQTAHGKTCLGVARRARAAGKPCVAFGGGVTREGVAALAAEGAVCVPIAEAAMPLDDLIAAGTGPVERAAERVARLVGIV